MPKMVKKLMPSEVKYGLLYVSELRDLFPEPSSSVTIIDSDGQRFDSKNGGDRSCRPAFVHPGHNQ